jgi:hypothetical protein
VTAGGRLGLGLRHLVREPHGEGAVADGSWHGVRTRSGVSSRGI